MHNIICTRKIKNKFFFHSLDIYLNNKIIMTMAYKILLTLLLHLTLTFSAFAQTDTTGDSIAADHQKYLTVKGIELKPGFRMEDALKAFEAKGWERSKYFDRLKEEGNYYELKGTFYNHNNCEIAIFPTNNDKNIVGRIIIFFPKMDSFKELKDLYDRLKYSLGKKYYMFSNTESFNNKNIENSSLDFLKLDALGQDEATFDSKFVLYDDQNPTLSGYVALGIDSTKSEDDNKYNVYVAYTTADDLAEQLNAEDDL